MAEVTLQPEDVQSIITGIATHPEAMESVAQLMRAAFNTPNPRQEDARQRTGTEAASEGNLASTSQQPAASGKFSGAGYSSRGLR